MTFGRYPAYKESGVEWIGDVPSHWDVVGSRRLFSLRDEPPQVGDRQLTASQRYGMIYQDDFMALEGQRVVQVITGADILKHVEPGDFVISMRSFQGGIEGCWVRGCTSSAYVVLVPGARVHGRFFSYALKSARYIEALQATSNLVRDGQALRFNNFAQVPLPLPSCAEQVQIARFLDAETTKLDALVAGQQQLVALLRKKRQAIISHAVTRGLALTDSRIDAAGTHVDPTSECWQVCALRHVVTRIEQGWSPECENRPADDGEWGVLKAGCVNRGIFNANQNKALPSTLEPVAAYEVREGDVLMSRASGSPELIGSAAVVGRVRPGLMLSDKIFRLRLAPGMVGEYLALLFGTPAFRHQIEGAISGAGGLANNLPQSALLAFRVVVPPGAEQQRIVAQLTPRVAALDTGMFEAERAIALLQNRRAALISAAVTGQIDVRAHAPAEALAA